MPPVEGMPHGCAWGLFDKDGKRDQYGTLNLLTPEVILAAKDEIKKGISVSVNLPLNQLHKPGFNRLAFEHKYIDFKPLHGACVHDDEIRINTQSGSQWDGFKHYAHQPTGQYYNGQPHASVQHSLDNGIHHWHDRGGIVGRGVLLDYVRHAAAHHIAYDVMSRHAISAETLDAMAREQNVTLRPGDILIVRSGFSQWYAAATQAERDAKLHAAEPAWAGVEGSMRTVEWLWDHHFAAVAGDSISWEQWPFNPDCPIHLYQLALWGSPIGEIWDLEKLAEVCEQEQRWSFFFTSAPLNVPGGVASPPNALCIL